MYTWHILCGVPHERRAAQAFAAFQFKFSFVFAGKCNLAQHGCTVYFNTEQYRVTTKFHSSHWHGVRFGTYTLMSAQPLGSVYHMTGCDSR